MCMFHIICTTPSNDSPYRSPQQPLSVRKWTLEYWGLNYEVYPRLSWCYYPTIPRRGLVTRTFSDTGRTHRHRLQWPVRRPRRQRERHCRRSRLRRPLGSDPEVPSRRHPNPESFHVTLGIQVKPKTDWLSLECLDSKGDTTRRFSFRSPLHVCYVKLFTLSPSPTLLSVFW